MTFPATGSYLPVLARQIVWKAKDTNENDVSFHSSRSVSFQRTCWNPCVQHQHNLKLQGQSFNVLHQGFLYYKHISSVILCNCIDLVPFIIWLLPLLPDPLSCLHWRVALTLSTTFYNLLSNFFISGNWNYPHLWAFILLKGFRAGTFPPQLQM